MLHPVHVLVGIFRTSQSIPEELEATATEEAKDSYSVMQKVIERQMEKQENRENAKQILKRLRERKKTNSTAVAVRKEQSPIRARLQAVGSMAAAQVVVKSAVESRVGRVGRMDSKQADSDSDSSLDRTIDGYLRKHDMDEIVEEIRSSNVTVRPKSAKDAQDGDYLSIATHQERREDEDVADLQCTLARALMVD